MSTDLPPDTSAAYAAWTFRGNPMRPDEFNLAMMHLYRGELERSNTWRARLDNTSNWAVAVTGAAIVLVFAGFSIHHTVVIIATLLVTWFLLIEARRYRYYELWSYRVRLMETDFFAAMLVPPFAPSQAWAENLAQALLQPEFPVGQWEAVGRRFRRNYIWLYFLLGGAWLLQVALYPTPVADWDTIVARAAIGTIPGSFVLMVGVLFNAALLVMGLVTARLQHASGEVLPKYGEIPLISPLMEALQSTEATSGIGALTRARKQLLIFIISAKPTKIAARVMKDMKRGVTALHGKGMYTEQEREVLMTVATVTEIAQLKSMVQAEDPNAFVVITPAHEVLGRGFQPLKS